MPGLTTRRPVQRYAATPDGARLTDRADTLAVEEPLEIRLGHPGVEPETFTVTMRTPGHDVDLALGFLVGEGVITSPDDVRTARHCATRSGDVPGAARDADGEPTRNVVEVVLSPGVALPDRARYRQVTSACGICGTASIEEVRARGGAGVAGDATELPAAVLAALPDTLRQAQRAFERTGGVHAAGLFTATGELVVAREDVGRHNAVDKVVGWAVQAGRLPLTGHVLQVSGRASFELVQKAVAAGCVALVAVGAPSSLAVDLADDTGLTLVGFTRPGSFNIYSGRSRITL